LDIYFPACRRQPQFARKNRREMREGIVESPLATAQIINDTKRETEERARKEEENAKAISNVSEIRNRLRRALNARPT
jgi:hypothetical protein